MTPAIFCDAMILGWAYAFGAVMALAFVAGFFFLVIGLSHAKR